jgi:transcriptional regulator with XRE-family HTH domain
MDAVNMTQSLSWKLRRVAAGIRQQDIALRAGMSTTRYSAIERGERVPSELEASLIDKFLPPLLGSELGQVCGGAR